MLLKSSIISIALNTLSTGILIIWSSHWILIHIFIWIQIPKYNWRYIMVFSFLPVLWNGGLDHEVSSVCLRFFLAAAGLWRTQGETSTVLTQFRLHCGAFTEDNAQVITSVKADDVVHRSVMFSPLPVHLIFTKLSLALKF